MDHATERPSYTPPELVLVGSLYDVTQSLHVKWLGNADGFLFSATSVTNTSP